MKKFRLLVTIAMFFSTLSFAQTRMITGKVTDDKGNAVSFATVTETNAKNAVKADANGNFVIAVTGNSLTISAVDHREKTISIKGVTADVILESTGELQ